MSDDETSGTSNQLNLNNFSDADFQVTIWRALRWVGIAVAVGIPLLWWKLGWPSAALFAVGALIAASGVYEWLRLLTALMHRMGPAEGTPKKVRPMASVLITFFLRLGAALALLYVSLKFLHGSVYALAAGLALGVLGLSAEGIRALKNWTV